LETEHYQPTPIKVVHSKPIKLCYADPAADPATIETPSNPAKDAPDIVPTTLSVAKKIIDNEGCFFFKSLFNRTSVMINKRALPPNCVIYKYNGARFATTQGTFTSPGFVYLTDLASPEFTAYRLTSLMHPTCPMI
jgi:hypothetical protein